MLHQHLVAVGITPLDDTGLQVCKCQAECTVINFTVTEQGLEDLLGTEAWTTEI